MSRDSRRSNYNRDGDFRHYNKNRGPSSKRSPPRHDDKHSLSNDRDLDENILREISKLPEPSEMWESSFNGPPPPPSFNHDYSGIYDDFPSALPSAPRPPDIVWNPQHPPPLVPTAPARPPPSNYSKAEDQIKKDAAIETEMRHQKAALSKQREDYMKKTNILKKELETLKDQRNELKGNDSKRSPSPDTKRFLKENTKLQLEIQNKLKTIHNVVDMLNSIIGEDAHKVSEPDEPVERPPPKRKSRSPGRCNYIYYDPEMHWCRICNEFPSTAKEYLNHLHTAAHHKTAAAHLEAPWHTVTGLNEGFPSYPSAPNKRTPIRGLQFFVPSTAWYCKLCDQFIGDLHCASAHLKSIVHSKNYSNFVEQNPHWETDWMSDRQKSFEKHHTKSKLDDKTNYSAHTITFCKDGFHTKKKEDSPPAVDERRRRDKKKNKKKRKSSSSSESESDSSDSEPVRKKKTKRKKYDEDEKLKAWMSIQLDKLSDHDKKIIDSLKNRIKTTHESDIKRDLRRDEFNRNSRERVSRQREPSKERKENRHKDREFKEAKRETREEREKPKPSAGAEKSETSEKKTEVKKMPFIGKMPVFKSLSKNKLDGKKKEEVERKKEDEVTDKKKREEIDAEIQKKVAEFREKINKSQLERMPPAILSPAELLPPPLVMQIPPPTIIRPIRPPPTPNPMNLQQDFQEALDIIFPSMENQKKNELKHESLFGPIPAALPPGFLNLPPGFPHPLVLPPGATPPPLMMGFDPMSHFRPQLYDNQVPINNINNHHHQPPTQQQMQHQHMQQQHMQQQLSQQHQQQQLSQQHQQQKLSQQNQQPPQKQKNQQQQKSVQNNNPDLTKPPPAKEAVRETREGKNKAELDELAMLGIDASDVGACM